MNSAKEKEILEKAVIALGRQTGLQTENDNRFHKRGVNVDNTLMLRAPREDRAREYRAEVKKNLNNASIAQMVLEAEKAKKQFVLVTEYVSQPQAEKLRSLDVAFFDTAGNAYFNEPGLYIFISGQKASREGEKPPRLFRPPGMRILFAILTTPKLENESYRRISAETGVPTPTVGVFMNDLEKAGYLVRMRNNERRIERREELFRRWVENYGESFRATLNPIRFHSTKYNGRWWEEIDLKNYAGAFWGGETGGVCLVGHLKSETVTIYSDSLLPKLQAKYGLVRERGGEVEILKKFWKSESEINGVAPPLVVYADLVATADRRNLETARMIYDRYLADIAKAVA